LTKKDLGNILGDAIFFARFFFAPFFRALFFRAISFARFFTGKIVPLDGPRLLSVLLRFPGADFTNQFF
jgi:hypothetical protein